MKVYLAAWYDMAGLMRGWREVLKAYNIETTSRWIDGGHDCKTGDYRRARQIQDEDLSDIDAAHAVLVYHPKEHHGRGSGGRHTEIGYAIRSGKPVVIIGTPENVFHYNPGVHFESNLADAVGALRLETGHALDIIRRRAEAFVETLKPLTFARLQSENKEWTERNFGTHDLNPLHPFLGVVEEVGELSHALLKSIQGIRGTTEEHEANAKDAVGDITVFLANFCSRKGWDYQAIIEQVWGRVKKRDFTKDPKNGGE